MPDLKREGGSWERTPASKAKLIADALTSKFVLPNREENWYSWILPASTKTGWLPIRSRHALQVLTALKVDSQTGPDSMSARMLKECKTVLVIPLVHLARRIVSTNRWPEIWVTHWIIPLFKRGSVFSSLNYRGIHFAAQLSKIMGRLLAKFF
jgi:hypothetical protein